MSTKRQRSEAARHAAECRWAIWNEIKRLSVQDEFQCIFDTLSWVKIHVSDMTIPAWVKTYGGDSLVHKSK